VTATPGVDLLKEEKMLSSFASNALLEVVLEGAPVLLFVWLYEKFTERKETQMNKTSIKDLKFIVS
jgi:hypothetical protein